MNVTEDVSLKTRLPDLRCAWATYEGVTITPSGPDLEKELRDEEGGVRRSFTIESVAQDAGVAESRRGFKALGLDPARYRPSQEALLRRVLKDQPVALINSGVDVCNLLSIRFRVPMGLYDADKIAGQAFLKAGTASDVYAALNGRDVECADKLILCDDQGPIGSPYVDSRRTAVDASCKRCLHVVYFCPLSLGADAFRVMMSTVGRHIAGRTDGYRWVRSQNPL